MIRYSGGLFLSLVFSPQKPNGTCTCWHASFGVVSMRDFLLPPTAHTFDLDDALMIEIFLYGGYDVLSLHPLTWSDPFQKWHVPYGLCSCYHILTLAQQWWQPLSRLDTSFLARTWVSPRSRRCDAGMTARFLWTSTATTCFPLIGKLPPSPPVLPSAVAVLRLPSKPHGRELVVTASKQTKLWGCMISSWPWAPPDRLRAVQEKG